MGSKLNFSDEYVTQNKTDDVLQSTLLLKLFCINNILELSWIDIENLVSAKLDLSEKARNQKHPKEWILSLIAHFECSSTLDDYNGPVPEPGALGWGLNRIFDSILQTAPFWQYLVCYLIENGCLRSIDRCKKHLNEVGWPLWVCEVRDFEQLYDDRSFDNRLRAGPKFGASAVQNFPDFFSISQQNEFSSKTSERFKNLRMSLEKHIVFRPDSNQVETILILQKGAIQLEAIEGHLDNCLMLLCGFVTQAEFALHSIAIDKAPSKSLNLNLRVPVLGKSMKIRVSCLETDSHR
jgi:hypothetical protein